MGRIIRLTGQSEFDYPNYGRDEDWEDDDMIAAVDRIFGPKKDDKFADSEVDLCSQLSNRDTPMTPDFLQLKLEDAIPVLVYGTLKQGGLYHEILDDCPYVGVGVTGDLRFRMTETTSFPVVFEVPTGDKSNKAKRGRIRGEVYMVSALTMLELDKLEGNGRMYQRKKVWTKMMDQGSSGVIPTLPTWMYIGNPNFFDNRFVTPVVPKHDSRGLVYDWDVNSFDARMAM